jgi:hypothetical protein
VEQKLKLVARCVKKKQIVISLCVIGKSDTLFCVIGQSDTLFHSLNAIVVCMLTEVNSCESDLRWRRCIVIFFEFSDVCVSFSDEREFECYSFYCKR